MYKNKIIRAMEAEIWVSDRCELTVYQNQFNKGIRKAISLIQNTPEDTWRETREEKYQALLEKMRLFEAKYPHNSGEQTAVSGEVVEKCCRVYMAVSHPAFDPDHCLFEGGQANWKLYRDGVKAILAAMHKQPVDLEAGARALINVEHGANMWVSEYQKQNFINYVKAVAAAWGLPTTDSGG